MPIRRGQDWGGTGALPPEGRIARTDSEVAALVAPALFAGADLPVVGLVGGDLRATLGGRSDEARLRKPTATRVTVDLAELRCDDGERHVFVAHAVARSRLWIGDIDAYMNASHIGPYDVAPRSHPGDGLLDRVTVAGLPFGQRVQARTRLRTGTHLPHPNITTKRSAEFDDRFGRRRLIVADGVVVGRSSALHVTLHPGVLNVVV